jgi:hypothetical protein
MLLQPVTKLGIIGNNVYLFSQYYVINSPDAVPAMIRLLLYFTDIIYKINIPQFWHSFCLYWYQPCQEDGRNLRYRRQVWQRRRIIKYISGCKEMGSRGIKPNPHSNYTSQIRIRRRTLPSFGFAIFACKLSVACCMLCVVCFLMNNSRVWLPNILNARLLRFHLFFVL